MDTNIIAALIGAGATMLAAILTIYGKNIFAAKKGKSLGYPDIIASWKASWYLDDKEGVYLEDVVQIKKVKGLKIVGEGINSDKGNYPLNGRFSKNLILNFIYESGSPYISMSGVVILKVDALGTTCKGRWYGYTKEDVITGGDVIWKRL